MNSKTEELQRIFNSLSSPRNFVFVVIKDFDEGLVTYASNYNVNGGFPIEDAENLIIMSFRIFVESQLSETMEPN